jgi:hypothetical protein
MHKSQVDSFPVIFSIIENVSEIICLFAPFCLKGVRLRKLSFEFHHLKVILHLAPLLSCLPSDFVETFPAPIDGNSSAFILCMRISQFI